MSPAVYRKSREPAPRPAFTRPLAADVHEDSGAAHVVSLLIAVIVFAIYSVVVLRSRAAMEVLIRGRRRTGVVAAVRRAVAGAWRPIALGLFAGLMVIYVAGLSLDLLPYYHAVTQTLGTLFLLIVFDRLTERAWSHEDALVLTRNVGVGELQARTAHRVVRAIMLVAIAWVLVSIWIDVIATSPAVATRSATAALGTLFIAFVAWELVRLAIDRHLVTQNAPRPGPAMMTRPARRRRGCRPCCRCCAPPSRW